MPIPAQNGSQPPPAVAQPQQQLAQHGQQVQGAMEAVGQTQSELTNFDMQQAQAAAEARAQRHEPETRRERLMMLLENFTGAFAQGLQGMSQAAPGQRSAGGVAGALQGRMAIEDRRRQQELEDFELDRQRRIEEATLKRLEFEFKLQQAELNLEKLKLERENFLSQGQVATTSASLIEKGRESGTVNAFGQQFSIAGQGEQAEINAEAEALAIRQTEEARAEAELANAQTRAKAAVARVQVELAESGVDPNSARGLRALQQRLNIPDEGMSLFDALRLGKYEAAEETKSIQLSGEQASAVIQRGLEFEEQIRQRELDRIDARLKTDREMNQNATQEQLQLANTLRDDARQQLANYTVMEEMMVRIRQSNTGNLPVGEQGPNDILMITSFMKMIDAGSTVRQEEFRTAATVGGLLQQLEVRLAQLGPDGPALSDDVRRGFAARAEEMWQTYSGYRESIIADYARQGATLDVPIEWIVPGYDTTPIIEE